MHRLFSTNLSKKFKITVCSLVVFLAMLQVGDTHRSAAQKGVTTIGACVLYMEMYTWGFPDVYF